MKHFLFLFIVISILSCEKTEKIDYAILKGNITNPKADKLFISKGQKTIKEILVDKEGNFNDTLFVDNGFYSFRHGNEASQLYLAPEYDLNLTLDTKQFDETIEYSGNGSKNNNYLADSFMNNEIEKLNYYSLFTKEENEFVDAAQNLRDTKLSFLNVRDSLSDDFISLEKKNLEFEYFLFLKRFPVYHPYYTKKEDFEPSEEFDNHFKDIDYTNEEDYNEIENYKNLVLNHYYGKITKSQDKKSVIDKINNTVFQSLKNDLAINMSYEVVPGNDENETLFNAISTFSDDKEFINKIEEKYQKVSNLSKGKPSPEFVNYENHSGGTTSLKDLNGKYVYIDVWATWCGPCLREIPSLKATEEKYHDKNIEFVSISIDTPQAYETWKKMVTDKDLGGTQLLADNNWKSKFVTDYAIEGIPRFILIDPKGNIVDANALRPSNPKLEELFDGLSI